MENQAFLLFLTPPHIIMIILNPVHIKASQQTNRSNKQSQDQAN